MSAEAMKPIEAERMRLEVGHLTRPHDRTDRREYVLTEAQLSRLIESIVILTREKRELHDRLHRLTPDRRPVL